VILSSHQHDSRLASGQPDDRDTWDVALAMPMRYRCHDLGAIAASNFTSPIHRQHEQPQCHKADVRASLQWLGRRYLNSTSFLDIHAVRIDCTMTGRIAFE
jgi:hypothetical protein